MKVGDMVKLDEEQFYDHDPIGLVVAIVDWSETGEVSKVEVCWPCDGERMVLEVNELEVISESR